MAMSAVLFSADEPAEGVLFLDVRSGPEALRSFEREHIAGARWIDLETELSHKADPAHGGRHPLPSTRAFVRALEAHGITADRELVLYDDKGGANAAARLWWMLRAIGHTRTRVLDGGFAAAKQRSIAMEQGPMPALALAPARYALDPRFERALEEGTREHPVASIEQVQRALREGTHAVIDVRDAARYRGESEPIDPIAGRIEGAINVPLTENLQADGRFKSAESLRAMYAEHARGPLIVHCGSGVTACHTLLALAHAGIEGAALYVGSYSEWCRRLPVAKG